MAYARRFLLGTISKSNAIPVAEVPDPPPQEEVTGETDFVVILAALICAIICVLGLIAVARCTWLRRGIPQNGSNSGATIHPSANKGLKKKVLNSLPKYTYNSSNTNTKSELHTQVSVKVDEAMETEDCAICLTEYVDGDEIRVLPHCGHGFHVECIDMWLGSHSSCPSCRQILAVTTRCRKCGEFDSAAAGGGGGGGSYKLTKVKPFSLAASSSSPTYLP